MTSIQLSALEILQTAREWTADCLHYPDTSVITDARAIRYVEAHYPGGYEAFEQDMGTATVLPVIPQ